MNMNQVIGSEKIESEDQGSQITLFLERYKDGKTIEKTFGPSFFGYITSLLGMRTVYILVFLVAVIFLIATIGKEEPLVVGGRDRSELAAAAAVADSRDERASDDKED